MNCCWSDGCQEWLNSIPSVSGASRRSCFPPRSNNASAERPKAPNSSQLSHPILPPHPPLTKCIINNFRSGISSQFAMDCILRHQQTRQPRRNVFCQGVFFQTLNRNTSAMTSLGICDSSPKWHLQPEVLIWQEKITFISFDSAITKASLHHSDYSDYYLFIYFLFIYLIFIFFFDSERRSQKHTSFRCTPTRDHTSHWGTHVLVVAFCLSILSVFYWPRWFYDSFWRGAHDKVTPRFLSPMEFPIERPFKHPP